VIPIDFCVFTRQISYGISVSSTVVMSLRRGCKMACLSAADHVHMTQIHPVTTKMRCSVYILVFACKVFQNSLVMLKAIAVTPTYQQIAEFRVFRTSNKTDILSTQIIAFITKCSATCFDQLYGHPQATCAHIRRPMHSGDGFYKLPT